MTLTLTIASLRKHEACDLDDRISDLRRVLSDVEEMDEVPLRTWWSLPTTSVADRWWSLRAVTQALEARRLGVRGAYLAARRVLPLARPQDRGVCLAAIEAAEAWVSDPTPERAEMCRRAANAANAANAAYTANAAAVYAAVYAADAAYAAANAAYAADANAADAAANAADAAAVYAAANAAAVYAAAEAAYAAAAEREAQRLDLDRLLEAL